MAGRVEGKVAVVTGAAMGLGEAIARRLAAEGAQVVLTDVAEAEGRKVADDIGPAAAFLRHDVSSEAEWAAVGDAVLAAHGRIDILVNNAGIQIAAPIDEARFEDWRKVQSVNADGVFLGCRMAVRAMKPAGGGAIVNVASVASHSGEPYGAAYCASKGAVRALTKSVAVYAKPFGIRCNSVHPGAIDTPMVWNMRTALGLPASVPGIGQPDDIAWAVLYLASDEARYVTGAELLVDNGRTITPPAPAKD
ncbi:MAG: oxidoreductase, short-chain dehydrogenase/reductase family [Phenylobacterium sp.]|nr:oxidoreductase, short-chain dehydrogenase/reductase family [Phenylobacterium sp.]